MAISLGAMLASVRRAAGLCALTVPGWMPTIGTTKGGLGTPTYSLVNLVADSWQTVAGMMLTPIRARRLGGL